MMWSYVYALMLSATCLAQHQQFQQAQQASYSSEGGDRQLRLEDIERDGLSSAQQRQTAGAQQLASTTQQLAPTAQQLTPTAQQLAAYQQQQLLLQQYYQPQPFFGGVPVMLVHSNHLGVGGPALQAYLLPAPLDGYHGAPFFHPAPQQVYVQPQGATGHRHNPQRPTPAAQRLQPIVAQPLSYQAPPQQYTAQQYTPQQYIPQQQYTAQQQFSAQQPTYNAYNAIYQQRQKFGAGVKSTVAPPLKESSQFAQPSSNVNYNNYKQF